jgi:flavin-dependent dehydrogenase
VVAQWDVAVIGAGPGGLAAAHAAASAGARTIVLERAEHPRYKTCGGGLIGASLAVADSRITVPARDRVAAVTFTENGRRAFTRRSSGRPSRPVPRYARTPRSAPSARTPTRRP